MCTFETGLPVCGAMVTIMSARMQRGEGPGVRTLIPPPPGKSQVAIDFLKDTGTREAIRPRGYKTVFMLNSTEHEIYPAHKCLNANNCWHSNNYQHDKYMKRVASSF